MQEIGRQIIVSYCCFNIPLLVCCIICTLLKPEQRIMGEASTFMKGRHMPLTWSLFLSSRCLFNNGLASVNASSGCIYVYWVACIQTDAWTAYAAVCLSHPNVGFAIRTAKRERVMRLERKITEELDNRGITLQHNMGSISFCKACLTSQSLQTGSWHNWSLFQFLGLRMCVCVCVLWKTH